MCKQEYLKMYQLQLRKYNRKSNVQVILRGSSLGCFAYASQHMSCSPLHAALPCTTPYYLMPTTLNYIHLHFLCPTVLLEVTSAATPFLTNPQINMGIAHFNSHRIWGSITKINTFFSLPTSQIPASVLTERDGAEHPAPSTATKSKDRDLLGLTTQLQITGGIFARKERLFQPSLLELQSPLPHEGTQSNITLSERATNNCSLLPAGRSAYSPGGGSLGHYKLPNQSVVL